MAGFKKRSIPFEMVEVIKTDIQLGLQIGIKFIVSNHSTYGFQYDSEKGIGPHYISMNTFYAFKSYFKTIKFLNQHYEEISKKEFLENYIMIHREILSGLYKELKTCM